MTLLACFLAAACSGAASVNGPEGAEDDGSTSVSSVQITPSSVALSVGSSAKLSVKVKSADGTPLDKNGTWTVEDPSVVDLEDEGTDGTVTVRSAGSTRVIKTVEGVSDTTSVDGTDGDVPQPPSGGDGEPAVVFDPDRYSSTQELMDDPYGVFSDTEIGGRYSLDTDVAPPGGSQSMRYDYVDQGATEQGVGRVMPLPERVREVWIEFEARWSENFFADAVLDDDKTSFSHKLLFARAQATATSPNWETSDGQKVSRWSLLWPMGGSGNPPNADIGIGSPRRVDGSVGTADPFGRIDGVNGADYFDERWHTVRLHLRHDPGRTWLEIDGEVVMDVTGFTIHPEVAIPAILVGRNKVTGNASGTESLWWGEISVWTQDPGW